MSNFINGSNMHKYKLKKWNIALNVFSWIFIVIITGIPLISFVLMIFSFFTAEKGVNLFAIVFCCILTPLIILLIFTIIQMTLSVVASFSYYLTITPDGIEQNISPFKHIRSNWSEVDKFGKFLFSTDVIYLKSFEVLGFSLSLKSPYRFFRPKQGFISLTGYKGWPDGQLAKDLKQYAPKLFEVQPIPQEIHPDKIEDQKGNQVTETPLLSQDVRLLAAISHASVLFNTVGLIVPVGIYMTQKKKSSYLGFQSLQALIWQFVMFIFSLLASSCMVGSIFIPVLLTTVSQNENLIGLSGGGVLIALIISVLVMTIGNLGFILYGIMGTIMTYQGKDFRYVFIGNRIDKITRQKTTTPLYKEVC